ncbi:MAG: hypothetical protein ACRBFS_24610 [Aureispira sp.]
MRLLIYLFAITFYTVSCSDFQNNNNQKHMVSNSDTSKIPDLNIFIEVDDIITLPELDGIEVYLENNSAQTIKIWENVNPSGLVEISFLFETEKNEKLLIEPVILNWKNEFSKVVEIEAYKKFKLNPQLTHWTINNSQIEKTDTIISGKIKAYYSVTQAFEKDGNVWEGKIISNEVQVKLKHNTFVNKK